MSWLFKPQSGRWVTALGLLSLVGVLACAQPPQRGDGPLGDDGLVAADQTEGLSWSDAVAPTSAGVAQVVPPAAAVEGRESIPSGAVSADPERPDMALTRRCLSLLNAHYLLPEKLEPASLFRGAVERLAAVADDALFLKGDQGEPDTLMVGWRSVLLDGSALKTADQLADALGAVATFYRRATVFADIETDEDLENTLISGMMATLDSPTRLLIDRGLENFEVRSRGSLIGVGLVLRMRDGRPYVREVVEGGPSHRGGVKRGDVIVRIDAESTLDMPLNEVVSRLRGEQGTLVSMGLQRRGSEEALSISVTREKVTVENVIAARLPGDIGYVEITNFSDLTLANFREKLNEMTASGVPLKGFVLDLRANRGGSLRQSAFMADQFLDGGLLVRTVGRDDERVRGLVERIDATAEMSIPRDVPVAVLVSPLTASGAEILAGALKYHDRAVIIGKNTYGKGTVQKVYKLAPEASLKATVARYLLEGDHWIHKVGLEPDIELHTIVVDETRVRFDDGGELAEQMELGEHEDSFHGQAEPQAAQRLSYVQDRRERPVEPDAEPTPVPGRDERLAQDFEVMFAAKLLQTAGRPSRAEMLSLSPALVSEVSAEQERALSEALRRLGTDWTAATTPVPSDGGLLDVKLSSTGPGGALVPSTDDVQLTLAVKLAGTAALHRVRVVALCEDRLLDGHDFFVGKLVPGTPAKVTLPIRFPPTADPGARQITLAVTADELSEPVHLSAVVEVKPIPLPRTWVSLKYLDNGSRGSAGDSDLIPEAGERLVLVVQVHNDGEVPTGEITASLRNPLRKDVEIVDSRVRLEPVAPGTVGEAVLSFDVKAVPEVGELPPVQVQVRVQDRTYGFNLEEPLLFAGQVAGAATPPPWALGGLSLRPPELSLSTNAGPGGAGAVDLVVTASDEDGLRVLTIYQDRVKVGRLIGATGAQALDLNQEIPVASGSHLIEVVAEDGLGLSSRRQLWVTGPSPDPVQAAAP